VNLKRVLIVSSDTIDTNMAGTGIRNWEIAHALAGQCKVTLATPNQPDLDSDIVNLVQYDFENGDLRHLAKEADAIIVQGMLLHFHPYLRDLSIPLAVDLYVPILLENLVWHDKEDWSTWIPNYEEYLRVQLELLRAGDFFYCASERQRDYWLGMLHAQKRLNPHTYRQDPTCRKLIDVVPYGIPENEPEATHPVLKGVHPNIAKSDKVILWSGGLWDWLDPLTLIKAIAQLVPQHPELKLWFMGTHHPNPIVKGMTMPEEAIELSQKLGLYGEHVFFNDWVPYNERANYLLEADFSVVSHPGNIETRFSFRTRVLDCIWARLPLIITEGDAMAEWVTTENLGYTVPPHDVSAMVDAIEKMLASGGRQIFEQAFYNLQKSLRWREVVLPLQRFCLQPSITPDKGHYLTEVERISRDKDAFLEKVVGEKDAFLEQVILDKDSFQEQVIHDKDAFLEQVIQDKDADTNQIINEKDQVINEKEKVIRDKINIIQEKDQVISEKEKVIREKINIIQEKDEYTSQILIEKTQLQQTIDRYRGTLPFQIYYGVKRLLRLM